MASTAEKIFETAKQLPDGLALEALHYLEYRVSVPRIVGRRWI